MNSTVSTPKVGLVTILYSVFLLIIAPFGRAIYNTLVDLFGRDGLSILIWLLFSFLFFCTLKHLKEVPAKRIVIFLVLIVCGVIYAGSFSIMEERMHLILFATYSWFVATDNTKLLTFYRIFITLVLSLMLASTDEILQSITPGRVGDVRDVVFNMVGAVWGLLLWHTIHRSTLKT